MNIPNIAQTLDENILAILVKMWVRCETHH